jgi:hypothetical protein
MVQLLDDEIEWARERTTRNNKNNDLKIVLLQWAFW